MKKTFLTIALLLFVAVSGHAQKFAVKTNLAGWAAAFTPNIGIEVALAPHWTIAADGYFNPIRDWGGRRSSYMWGAQPEVKYWFCRKFYSHYLGLHGQYSQFDAGLLKYRYEGAYWGVGLSYGYSLPVAYRWRLDFSIGVGWQHWEGFGPGGRVYPYRRVGSPELPDQGSAWNNKEFVDKPLPKDTFGITKVGISAVFIIR